MIGCLLSTFLSVVFLSDRPPQVERAAETRVAREQKRAAEQEEAARCFYNFDHADHRLRRGDHEMT